MAGTYSELFCQSNFSFLTGASHPEELVGRAAELGYSALALCDECSVAGVVRAHSHIKAQQLPIKLIVGSYLCYEELELVVLCPTKSAYSQLCRVITNARRRCEKGRYQLSEWDLKTLKGCILIWLVHGRSEAAKVSDRHWGLWLQRHYGDQLYLGVRRELNGFEPEQLAYVRTLSEQWQIKEVALGAVLMHTPERLPLQHVLSAIKQGQTVSSLGQSLLANAERALRPQDKLAKLFSPTQLATSEQIAQSCAFNLDELSYQYPYELVPQGLSASEHLKSLVEQGARKRFKGAPPPAIQATIDKELALIAEQGYEPFFLTIHDIVQFAKRHDILYQGRGSAANSVVCYCLEITAVDPRQIDVLFERFISKERNEPPDIDVDFEHQRREEVFQYIYQKYGRQRAALAATVITYRLKSAMRDVGKALGFSDTQLDYYIKQLNRRHGGGQWQAQLIQLGLDPEATINQHFFRLVDEIKGFPRHLSQHVGGFVISEGPLHELVPVENAAMLERTVIQWDKDDLESLKLLKVDVLALGMLSAIQRSFKLLEKHYQHSISIADITRLGDDPQVYAMLQKADTVGVFQIESRAQMSMLPRLKPRCYYDLVIQIAIVRPGPIQGDMVHPYLRRRDGDEAVEYPSKQVEQVLKRTLGVPIFQEQVIKVAMVAAGFSGGEADQLRRAMAKWKRDGELTQFKQKLIDGMLQRGYDYQYAERIYQQICGFGEYGFPESHSASFAVLAYVSAYLKYYYPEVFFCALANSLPMGFYSLDQLVQDARRHNINILAVDVNHSLWEHQVIRQGEHVAVRLGFCCIKGFSAASADKLIAQRPTSGYRSISELYHHGLQEGELETLASSNALAAIAKDRFNSRWQIMDKQQRLPLFADDESIMEEESVLAAPSGIQDTLEDYASMGVNMGAHPLTYLRQQGLFTRAKKASELSQCRNGASVTIAGLVTGRQSPGSAAGVTFLTLEDDTGNINVVVWLATAKAQQKAFLTARLLEVKGVVEHHKGVVHVIAGRLIDHSDKLPALILKSRFFH
ncbi:error-prone DNA polymerase [Pseudoalteromonas sp. T1lg10]|uniref:error-prone DNA polymerase n=1 Tax=Pseudoalteromonas sp. T1lg10 TaxID=2077093 RepID=UPI000CF60494|nr:error-prone DNA polymerase [Pseudoalteromonas sp. T1lg10]